MKNQRFTHSLDLIWLPYMQHQLEGHVAAIRKQVEEIIADHNVFLHTEHKRLGQANRERWSRLRPYIQDVSGGVYIFWRWYYKSVKKPGSTTGEVLRFSRPISKGKTVQYPAARLTKYAERWEIETVLALESRFRDIRVTLAHIANLRGTCSALEKGCITGDALEH